VLFGSMAAAVTVAVATAVTLLLVDPALSKTEAIKTGGLAGGAIVALYALWLNDRRRRTEEARHELESDKVADERFARAVEMLGNDADQVRVGALHALAGLHRAVPRYRQTVLDVLCAYLRRPFLHPAYLDRPGDPDQVSLPNQEEADRERTVRLTAQRLISDLLPWGQNDDASAYHLDLSGANLEYFRLSGRRIGRLVARRTQFYGITQLAGVRATKPALFTAATFHGIVFVANATFLGGISFQETGFHGKVEYDGAVVGTFIDLHTTAPEQQTGTLAVLEGTNVKGDVGTWVLAGIPTASPDRAAEAPERRRGQHSDHGQDDHRYAAD
jgi:hypothetical protein